MEAQKIRGPRALDIGNIPSFRRQRESSPVSAPRQPSKGGFPPQLQSAEMTSAPGTFTSVSVCPVGCCNLAKYFPGAIELALHVSSQRRRGKAVSFIEFRFKAINPLQKIAGVDFRSRSLASNSEINGTRLCPSSVLSIGPEGKPSTSVDLQGLFKCCCVAIGRKLSRCHDSPVVNHLCPIQRRLPGCRGSSGNGSARWQLDAVSEEST